MNDTVLVRGDGVAAACCVRSLSGHGLPVSVVRAGRPKLSAVLLGEATQSLLTDLFADKKLLAGLPQIRKRVVAWGPGAQAIVLPHSALVISEHDLLERLWARAQTPVEATQNTAAWEIISSRMEDPGGNEARAEGRFGSRSAFVSHVQLKTAADRESCWAESLDAGWLFLFPVHGASACLISVGGPALSQIAESRLIVPRVPADSLRALRIGLAGVRNGRHDIRPIVRRGCGQCGSRSHPRVSGHTGCGAGIRRGELAGSLQCSPGERLSPSSADVPPLLQHRGDRPFLEFGTSAFAAGDRIALPASPSQSFAPISPGRIRTGGHMISV